MQTKDPVQARKSAFRKQGSTKKAGVLFKEDKEIIPPSTKYLKNSNELPPLEVEAKRYWEETNVGVDSVSLNRYHNSIGYIGNPYPSIKESILLQPNYKKLPSHNREHSPINLMNLRGLLLDPLKRYNLTHLDLTRVAEIVEKKWQDIGTIFAEEESKNIRFRNLKMIDARGCWDVSDTSLIVDIAKRSPKLTSIIVSYPIYIAGVYDKGPDNSNDLYARTKKEDILKLQKQFPQAKIYIFDSHNEQVEFPKMSSAERDNLLNNISLPITLQKASETLSLEKIYARGMGRLL